MWLIDHEMSSPGESLAFDEALVETADTPDGEEAHRSTGLEACRLWELTNHAVILGRGSKIAEVQTNHCEADRVPIFRRCSGGATVLAGPGCFLYSLLFSLADRPPLRDIDFAHRWVMGRLLSGLQKTLPGIQLNGTCDLTLGDRKFSGNAVRYKRDWVLYHGTICYELDLAKVSRYLAMPARQPSYRGDRSHAQFLTNVPLDRSTLVQLFHEIWQATGSWEDHPFKQVIQSKTAELKQQKYP
jgi:lipoate---protein ligase